MTISEIFFDTNQGLEKDVSLIFHISSAEVVASIVSFKDEEKQNKKPNIFYTVSEKIDFLNSKTQPELEENTLKSLKKVLIFVRDYLQILGLNSISNSYVFLSSPWVKKNIFTVKNEKANPFLVDEKYFEKVIDSVGQVQENEILLKAEIISVKANGYNMQVLNVLNKKVFDLEISFLDTVLSKRFQKKIDGAILSEFRNVKNDFFGFVQAFLNQVYKIYNIERDFVFLDFTGKVIDFGIFEDQKISFLSEIAVEEDFFQSIVNAKLAKNIQEAKYTTSLYAQNKLQTELQEKIDKIAKQLSQKIQEKIQSVLDENDIQYLPENVFVFSSPEMKKVLEKIVFFEKVMFVDRKFLKNFISAVDIQYWNNFIAIEAEYISDLL